METKKIEKGIVLEGKTKEQTNLLRAAILNNFTKIWVFHFFNTVSERRYLKVCSVWDGDLPEDQFNEIKSFSDNFMNSLAS